ncbi:hypothetical protein [Nonomuraea lactucae]|uniref:hypothetical protein n=1 Tax=Nonomuraea lactucae TaxID=2249762 RepID=UPI000DE1CF60|nr:hypothetical protein [Nonomuraea lactucae]
MSQRRSGLLSGLVVGLIATPLTAAAYAAALFFGSRPPFDVRWLGDGLVLPIAVSLAAGLIVGFAVRAVRPRSLLLPLFAALYACAAVGLGTVAFHTASWISHGSPVETVGMFLEILTNAALRVREMLTLSWWIWLMGGVAALPAFVLPLVRALRQRRARPVRAAHRKGDRPEPEPEQDQEKEHEQEYRAPFEPVQPAKPATTGATVNPFAPREPGQD